MVTAKSIVQMAFVFFKGKSPTKAPLPTDPKFAPYLIYMDALLQNWALDPEYNWKTLIETEEVEIEDGEVSLPQGFIRFASPLYINDSPVKVVDISERRLYTNAAYITGGDEPVLRFTTKNIYNDGTLFDVDYIVKPVKITNANSPVICDSHVWLASALAAEIAKNDTSKQDLYPDLVDQADANYKLMAAATFLSVKGQPRKTPIRGYQTTVRPR